MRVLAAVTAMIIIGGPATPAFAVDPVVRFHSVQYDSPGSDNRSAASLNQEWIAVVNTGRKPVSLLRWSVRDATGRSFAFGNVTLAGDGARVVLHTGKGSVAGVDVFGGSGNYVWNNAGDTARLVDASGRTVDSCTWKAKKDRTWVAC